MTLNDPDLLWGESGCVLFGCKVLGLSLIKIRHSIRDPIPSIIPYGKYREETYGLAPYSTSGVTMRFLHAFYTETGACSWDGGDL